MFHQVHQYVVPVYQLPLHKLFLGFLSVSWLVFSKYILHVHRIIFIFVFPLKNVFFNCISSSLRLSMSSQSLLQSRVSFVFKASFYNTSLLSSSCWQILSLKPFPHARSMLFNFFFYFRWGTYHFQIYCFVFLGSINYVFNMYCSILVIRLEFCSISPVSPPSTYPCFWSHSSSSLVHRGLVHGRLCLDKVLEILFNWMTRRNSVSTTSPFLPTPANVSVINIIDGSTLLLSIL